MNDLVQSASDSASEAAQTTLDFVQFFFVVAGVCAVVYVYRKCR